MADTPDLSQVPTEELLKQLAPRPNAVQAPAAAAATAAPAAPAPPAAGQQPDYSKMSTEELLALPTGPAAKPGIGDQAMQALQAVGHGAGVVARGVTEGALALPGMVSDAVTGPINSGLDATLGEGKGFRFQRVGAAADNLMTAAGVPQAQNATERVAQDVAGGVGSALGGMGAGAAIGAAGQVAGPITRALAAGLAANPGMQIGSAAAGGAASGVAREAGAGPAGQAVAGLAGALAPTVLPASTGIAARNVLRGADGGAGQARMEATTDAFNQVGAQPSLGQATGNRGVQAAETAIGNTVGGSSVMDRFNQRQIDAMDQTVQNLIKRLSPGGSNATDAGTAIANGVNAFKGDVKATQERLYNVLDQHIPAATPIDVTRTQQALADLNADIPGAPNLSQLFKNARIKGIDRALLADVDAAAQAQAPVGLGAMGAKDLPTGQLPYEAIKKLRTLVGNEISDGNLTSDVPRSKWKALYGALSDDLGTAAQNAGPAAQSAWSRANTYTRASMDRLEQLQQVISKNAPENVYKAAISGVSEGATTIRRVMRSIPVDDRKQVAATALQRLGKANPGNQDEVGSVFSSEKFLTNLVSMHPDSKQALFGSLGLDSSVVMPKLDALAKVAAVRRDSSKVFANPSGTARQAGLIAWASSLGGAAATGSPRALAIAIAAPIISSSAAKVATSPSFVAKAASDARVNAAIPAIAAAATARATKADSNSQPSFPTYIGAAKARRDQNVAGEITKGPAGWVISPK